MYLYNILIRNKLLLYGCIKVLVLVLVLCKKLYYNNNIYIL